MRCIDVVEGEDFILIGNEAERLREAVERLRVQLKPSFSLLAERAGTFRLTNVVGTVDLGAGLVLQVAPKVDGAPDWVTAVVALLTGKEGIDVAGERRAGFSKSHNRLLDAIAKTYLRRLERAFRQEGPIVLMERRSVELPSLNGRLDVTRWARTALWRPHIFPVVRTEFAQDNPFTRGLVYVADALAHISTDQKARSGPSRTFPGPVRWHFRERAAAERHRQSRTSRAMERLQARVVAGHGHPFQDVTLRANRRPCRGWPGHRGMAALGDSIGTDPTGGPTGRQCDGARAVVPSPRRRSTTERTWRLPQEPFSPRPDGRLFENGKLLATFEAKYSAYSGSRPQREHIYQALTTAAACGAATAVLVYPETFEPQVWDVTGLSGQPMVLVAVGLGLYKWLPPSDAEARAEKMLALVDRLAVTASAPQVAAVA